MSCAAGRPSEWLVLLAGAGVPCAPVNDVAGALADPQVAAREAMIEYEHPRLGTVRQAASPLRIDGAPRRSGRAPTRDEHRLDVLRRVCGYDDATIELRESEKAFG